MVMKIGIVGWGIEGQSAFNYFGPENEYLIVNEHPRGDFPTESEKIKIQHVSEEKPRGVTSNVADLSYLEGLQNCDKIVYTPTACKNLEKYFGDEKAFWDKATTTLQIFFETVKTKNIIGVTGTKGKGTTSTLIYEMLQAAGKKTYLGGNIGNSVLGFVNEVQPDDWVVLELSSFQLHKFPYSPHIGVTLMIVPEHLDWHFGMSDYLESKSNLFRHQQPEDKAIYFADNQLSMQIAQMSPGEKIPFYRPPGAFVRNDGMIIIQEQGVIHKSQVKLVGEHNLQNICAAITAVWQVTTDLEAIDKVLKTFSGLEHRLEFVKEVKGVNYYDDSFGTTPETAIVALRSFTQPKVLILGGSYKGIAFDKLADAIGSSNVRHVIAIGDTGPKIAELLKLRGFSSITEGLNDMPAIVAEAKAKALQGDVVLLSTGSASFGMFKDYKDRGNQFKQTVATLA